eukprot:12201239-Ditylum_brightwellii.AAC.1
MELNVGVSVQEKCNTSLPKKVKTPHLKDCRSELGLSPELRPMFRVFANMKNKHNSLMVFDPTYPEIYGNDFPEFDWKEFYEYAKKPFPPNAPKYRGKEVDLILFVDSDHAGDRTNRRSRTEFFIYLIMAPIVWH